MRRRNVTTKYKVPFRVLYNCILRQMSLLSSLSCGAENAYYGRYFSQFSEKKEKVADQQVRFEHSDLLGTFEAFM